MTVEIPVELWIRVLSYLARPIPQPRSNPPRADLLEPDLISAILTCKLFQSIGEKLLYSHISTSRLTLLLPHNPDEVPAKRRLFAHTQSIRVEYSDKTTDPVYTQLLEQGLWTMVGLWGGGREGAQLYLCAKEILILTRCLTVLEHSDPISQIFPKLRKLSIGSVYGGDDELWRRYTEYHKVLIARSTPESPTTYPHPSACWGLFYNFCQSSHITHFCTPSQSGPLHIPSTFASANHGPTNDYSFTVHIPAALLSIIDHLPISYGKAVIWSVEAPTPVEYVPVTQCISRVIDHANAGRICPSLAQALGSRPADLADVTMYCQVSFDSMVDIGGSAMLAEVDAMLSTPTSSPATPSADVIHRHRVGQLGHAIQSRFKEGSGLKDVFRWIPANDAPPCLACNFSPSLLDSQQVPS